LTDYAEPDAGPSADDDPGSRRDGGRKARLATSALLFIDSKDRTRRCRNAAKQALAQIESAGPVQTADGHPLSR